MIGIIIPFKGNLEYTKICIESISCREPYTIIGVDNGDEETADYIGRIGCVIEQKELNISKMWNDGIEFAISAGCDKFIIMNTDICLFGRTIEKMSKALDKHYCAQPLRIESQSGYNPLVSELGEILLREDSYKPGGICGPCFGLSLDGVNALKEDGCANGNVFDEQFKLFYGDADLLRRLYKLGHPPVDIQNAVIYHYYSKTLLTINFQKIIEEDAKCFKEKYE